ncbi:MAG: hypothetical protein ACI9E1_001644, partial [Cryomorphaceae bacterium]
MISIKLNITALIVFTCLLFFGSIPAKATSVDISSHSCPLCKRSSKVLQLMSYSSFGEPSRDFLDSPAFMMSSPSICPWDLYVASPELWDEKNSHKLKNLKLKLERKPQAILVSQSELDFIRSKNSPLETNLRRLWWFRTIRGIDNLEQELHLTLQLFSTCYGDDKPIAELREYYRAIIIELLIKNAKLEGVSSKNRIIYQYLKAEFHRKGGELKLARQGFDRLNELLSKLTEKEREHHQPVTTWSYEQALQIMYSESTTRTLKANILLPLPNPFRDRITREAGNVKLPEWSKQQLISHQQTLAELINRTESGDKSASEILWEIIDEDTGKLIDIAEITSGGSLQKMGIKDPRWETWRQKVVKLVNKGEIPKGAQTKINQERNINILKGWLGSEEDIFIPNIFSDQPKKKVSDTIQDRLRTQLKLMESKNAEQKKKALNKALVDLRILTAEEAKKHGMFSYPLAYYSIELAKYPNIYRDTINVALTQKWQSPYLRELAGLWANKPKSLEMIEDTEALKKIPQYAGYDAAEPVYAYLNERQDPRWKDRCIKDLLKIDMVNRHTIRYAKTIGDSQMIDTLQLRYQKASKSEVKNKPGQWNWQKHELLEYEAWLIDRKLSN